MALELLEKRLAPAGIVSIVLTDGALKITGDTADNILSITETAPGTFVVAGTTTGLTFDGGEGASFIINGVTKGLTIDLKEGGDVLNLHEMSVDGGISIALGAGDNTLNIEGDLNITGDLTVTALKGADSIISNGQNLTINGKTTFNLSDGANIVELSGMSVVSLGSLFYIGGAGADRVDISAAILAVNGAMDLKVGAGTTAVAIIGAQSLTVNGALSFTALDHLTTTSTFAIGGGSLQLDSHVAIKNGAGDTVVKIKATDDLIILGNLSITTGAGAQGVQVSAADRLEIGGNVSVIHGIATGAGSTTQFASEGDLRILGSFSVTNGAGGHNTRLEADSRLEVGGKVSISNGAGTNVTFVGGDGEAELMDSLTISNKTGLATNSVTAQALHVQNAITITNAGVVAGGPEIISFRNTISGNTALHAGAISITNGNGLAANRILMELTELDEVSSAIGTVTQGITIKNGIAPSIIPPPLGEPLINSSYLSGNFSIGGNVAFTNGSGSYGNLIGSLDAAESIYIGGSLTLTNGNAGSRGYVNVLAAESLTVNKGLTIKNGNSDIICGNQIKIESFTVNGAFSITNGNTSGFEFKNTFDIGEGSFGSVIIKNGTAQKIANEWEAESLKIAGAFSITNGNATQQVTNALAADVATVGSVIIKNGTSSSTLNAWDGTDLTITGALSLTNGNVTGLNRNSWDIGGDMSLGSVVIKNGNGEASNILEASRMNILGAVNISSGITTETAIANEINGVTVVIGGPVTFATKGGDATHEITGLEVKLGSGLTINSGSGDDVIEIGGADGTLFVAGSIVAKLGTGDDVQISIGGSNASVTISGSVNIAAQAEAGALAVTGDGRIGGSITAALGASESIAVSVGGNEVATPGSLNVGGIISLTAGVDATVAFSLRDGSFAALTLNGGSGKDEVLISGAILRGAVKLDLKADEDLVRIDDSTFLKTFTALTGAGADTVAIETSTAPELANASRFYGAVNIDLGTQNDTLTLQSHAAPNALTFYSSVTFIGGTGANTYLEAESVEYLGAFSKTDL